MDKQANNGHAKFAPSGSHRWLVCHGSVILCQGLQERQSSSYAEEGTECHEAGGLILSGASYNESVAKLSDDQIEIVDAYTDFVFETMDKLNDRSLNPKIWIEQKVKSSLNDDYYGTADCGILAGSTLAIIDLKAGFIPVRVHDEHFEINPQLGSYALQFLDTHQLWTRVKRVKLIIVQPRVYDKPQEITIPVEDLVKFADRVQYSIKAIEKGDPTLVAGEHCQFCPAKGKCPELRSKAVEKAKLVFGCPKQPKEYTNQEIAEILNEAAMIEAHIEGVRQYARREMEKGREIPGWKLVMKRAVYKWTAWDTVAGDLKAEHFDTEDLYTLRPKTPLQLEKIIKHYKINYDLAPHFIKESSGPTLAPEGDKRDAVRYEPFTDQARVGT